MSTEENGTIEEEVTLLRGRQPLHEDAVRLVRQRLIALEENRTGHAKRLKEFLAEEFGLEIQDVKVNDVSPTLYKRWREYYGLPEGTETVTLLVNYAREPIWRVPKTMESREPSIFETPLHLQPPHPYGDKPNLDLLPEQLHPRKDGALPEEIQKALSLPDEARPVDAVAD